MSDHEIVGIAMGSVMAAMVCVGIVAAVFWADTRTVEAEQPIIDADLIELEWSTTKPTEPGFYWFKGTVKSIMGESEEDYAVFVVHENKMATAVSLSNVYEQDERYFINCDLSYVGQWAKLEKPL